MTDLRSQVALVAGEKNPLPIYSGTLADDYDGISEYVAVALSRGAAGAAIARVAPGSSLSGQFAPSGTAVSVISINGHLEVISLGSRVATNYTVTTIDTGYVEPTISPVVLQAGELVDSSDNVSVSSEGMAGGWGRLIQAGGIYNSDWELLPPDPSLELSDDNLPPYWKYFYSSNPSTAHLQVVTLDETYNTVLRCTLDSSSSFGDYAWVGQEIAASAQIDFAAKVRFGPLVDSNVLLDIIADWYSSNGKLLARTGGGQLISIIAGSSTAYQTAIWNLNLLSPADASKVRIWFGIRVNTPPGVQEYFDILEVGATGSGLVNLKLPDTDPATADNTSEIYEYARSLRITANVGGAAGLQPHLMLNGDTSTLPGILLMPGGETERAAFDPEHYASNSSVNATVTSAGTYYFFSGTATASITPAFVGQRFLVIGNLSAYASVSGIVTIAWRIMEGDATTLVTTMGYSRHEAATTDEWGHHSYASIWTADSTDARRFRPYVTHTTDGAVITASYFSLIMIPLPI